MARGPSARAGNAARALRLLRLLLPLCLVAAALVAGQGLFRVVGSRAAEPLPQDHPSLSLGANSNGPTRQAAAAVPAQPSFAPITPKPAAPKPRPQRPERLTQPVVVVNASNVRGLATRTATMLRERGVTVVGIGNLTAPQKPPTPTVFYPPGQDGQARALASLTATRAVAPAPQWLQAAGKLVLVVTDTSTSS